jgi:hypothetical protein
MTWFKFLAAGATGPFSGYRWPVPDRAGSHPGTWVVASPPLDPCLRGLHVCREADLPFWLHEELYVVDVEGPVQEYDSFVLARRARLLRRVEGWGPEAARRLSRACAWRVRDLTAEALRQLGRRQDAGRLGGCSTLDELGSTAGSIAEGAGFVLAGYASDAATLAAGTTADTGWASAAAATTYVAETAAAVAARPEDREAASTAERLRQARWIAHLAPAPR